MAEAYVNQLAKERGLDVHAESAGTIGAKGLNPTVSQAMAKDGISMEGQEPKILTQEMADRADRIVTMGCGVDAEACPARILVSEDWGLDDPAGQPIERVELIRNQIRSKVENLLSEAPRRW